MTRRKGPVASTYQAPVVAPALAETQQLASALAESPEGSVRSAPAAAWRRVEHPEQVAQPSSPARAVRAASRGQAGWAAAADQAEASALEEPQG